MHPSRTTKRPLWLALLPAAVLALASPTQAEEASAADGAAPDRPACRVLVVYYSLTGNTEAMAKAVAEGVREVPGAAVVVRRVEKVSKEDLEAADGLILGSPAYFADVAGTMKTAIDDWNWKMKVDFTNKVGGAFSTGGGQAGGKEHVLISLLLFMVSNRMVVAGPLYQDAEGDDKWGEIGATAMTGPLDPGVGEKERDAARRLGRRIARLTAKIQGR